VDVRLVPVDAAEHDAFFELLAAYHRELDPFDPLAEVSPWDAEQYRSAVLDDLEDREILWIEAEGQRAGFVMVRTLPDWPDESRRVATISEFYVAPASRRRGIGRRAVEALLAEHRRRGTHLVEADILRDNDAARAFWASLGFEVVMHQTARRP
jgi:ribosomal protein S18 acetylase RimI-like enzyme